MIEESQQREFRQAYLGAEAWERKWAALQAASQIGI